MLKKMPLLKYAGLALIAWLVLLLPYTTPAVEANSCVACHSQAEVDNITGKNYLDWKGSIHDNKGVLCDDCHLGDAASANKESAHTDVYRPGDPRSTVYFKNIPKTCGKCHKEEYNQFRKSLHYLRLETTERGPSCVTCHGARATKIVTPPQMADLCTLCHNERLGIQPETPRTAHSTLLLMNQTELLVEVLTGYVETTSINKKSLNKALDLLQQTRNSIKLAKLRWHTFDLDAIGKSITGAESSAREAWTELKKK